MKTTLKICSVFLLLFIGGGRFTAQVAKPQTPDIEKIWTSVQARLEQPGSDTTYSLILDQVRSYCDEDYDCLYQTYHALMLKLGEGYHLPGAIYLCEEMAKIAHRHENLRDEASANMTLNNYYGALGYLRLAAVNIDKALALFEQMGDSQAITRARMSKLEQSLSHRTMEEVLPEMNALLAKSIETGDAKSALVLHIRLVGHTMQARRYDETEEHIAALEKMPVSDPVQPNEYATIITAALGRADLAMTVNDWDAAEPYYQKTLQFAKAEPNRWMETHVLNSLANLEWKRGNTVLAKTYLDKAQTIAEKLELHDLLIRTFNLKTSIAEKEGNYAGAFRFSKKERYHDEKFKSKSAGFDIENYYLELEKNQLAAEKKTKELELSLKKAQLRNSLIIIALALPLAIMLVFSFIKLRKRKNELAAQNALILEQSDQLKNLDAAKSRFFANISHELRTPLTLVLGPIASVIKESHLTEKQLRLLQMANRSGEQLEQLVNEILDLRKLEMGKMKLDKKPTVLSPFFSKYIAQFESLAYRKQIHFSFEILMDREMAANIDREKCRQILFNLLSNAFKFTPVGGKVMVKLEIGQHGPPISKFPNSPISNFRISVEDTGPGIHPDDLPHIFDRYFQTNRPEKPAEGGTGIGLALCHEYAQLFGGKTEVESTLGKGSTFRVAFPVEVVTMENHAPTQENLTGQLASDFRAVKEKPDLMTAPTIPIDPTKETILVVEDNPELQDYIRLILQEKYNVITAGNGQAAMGVLQSTSPSVHSSQTEGLRTERLPDLILSDLMMPMMDGYQLLEKLKADETTRHIPVIMLTARAEAKDRLKALRIGVDDYLTKPFDEEELVVRIENLLTNHAVRQEAASEMAEETEAPDISQPDQEWLETFEAFVQKNLSNSILGVSLLTNQFAMSESTLLRQLKRLTGLTPQKYLQEIRLNESRQLLENRQFDSIEKVASAVGYTDARNFSRSFKGRFGKLPSEWLTD